jgi:hypothetical protein
MEPGPLHGAALRAAAMYNLRRQKMPAPTELQLSEISVERQCGHVMEISSSVLGQGYLSGILSFDGTENSHVVPSRREIGGPAYLYVPLFVAGARGLGWSQSG